MRSRLGLAGAVACVLAGVAAARAQHAGDMLLASTAAGGGALALDYDFATRVLTFESASGGGNILYSTTDPGWDLLVTPSGGAFPLAGGTPVSVEITAIDPGVSLKVSTTTLNAVGQSRVLGAAPSVHVHPTWQLVLPAGEVGERMVSFRMTTTSAAYAPSATYTAVLSNTTTTTTSPGATTTTLGGATTTTSVPGTVTSSTSVTTSTTLPGASTTSTTTVPATSTTTTLAPRGELLGGTSLSIRARRRSSILALVSRDARVGSGGGRGSTADPTLHGGTLHLSSTAAAFDAVHLLPARNWRALTRRGAVIGWRYADPKGLAGPVTGALVKTGKLLRVTARGGALGISPGENPAPVLVALAAGEHRWCLRFGGTVRWKAPASFTARGAPAPTECLR